MSRPQMHFAVGDEVVWTSVNHRGARRYTVTGVGRKLIRIAGDRCAYRMSDGARNDGYAHEHIRPVDVYEWDERAGAARLYLIGLGLRPDFAADDERIVWAADVLRAADREREKDAALRGEVK